ncbi:MAG: Serine-tRNA ligase [Candidatus Nomurabacteria bacterium GW2011_GWF2_35_66]|uniref:Serine--tRNA ligase n=1 Tax=Candidatus Nomurabacteria bacterium GW2011_GWE1_35_16 TaxID=1618761 RepID=A0A0G0BAN3_9BACT|nr:MAG: Serine-tRNA ligase [Candidatus Nomurabacteria bacterium GW2011_GWF1_34_20]KKP62990.1 MAG: Serine-tRNA ligase [Candidatus Nomurabacteria bacterium GW2011_GWE2_34_25]KKP66394.1 MAG: Serine-tRNA ligase [Candidatus Nomurabacteria bacterium GW2011_GWE1_35_16]KKP83166.1 MAG: Serine-tRNA ligase [Candidatus Nomurabacteria bacterium GW2011_GWF2_35_66]HAE36514.1 serine--tRNA ligase [Candidatus Nomurabacteria bacterium]
MLDIKFIRENKDIIKEGAKKKHIEVDIDKLVSVDEKRLEILSRVEFLRGEQNKMNNSIATEKDMAIRGQMIGEMKMVKEELVGKEEELRTIMTEWQSLMLTVPNIPDISVPEGESDADNQEVKSWGEKPVFDFEAKDHIELMTNLKMVDFDRGVKVHGFRGYFLIGDGARLSMAIWSYALDFFSSKGLLPVIPPVIDHKENFIGTAMIPQSEEDLYKTQDGNYLAGTAEVPIMGMHANEILDQKVLPLKYLGFSPCFRLEAGSHGKDVKGLIRVQEFYKMEQVVLCEANHEVSVRVHEDITRNSEEFLESLGIPYHTVINCGGDLGLGQVKKYDIEAWVPKESKYRETHSASYFHDFQTRRLNIRYKDEDGKMKYVHSLNNTAVATPRILVSLVENFQQADGTIKVPTVLQKYLGKDIIS